jgi:hypothetical protein
MQQPVKIERLASRHILSLLGTAALLHPYCVSHAFGWEDIHICLPWPLPLPISALDRQSDSKATDLRP